MSADLATDSPRTQRGAQRTLSPAASRPDFGQDLDLAAHLAADALPRWRGLLELHWRARLERVTELSLAYHDAQDAAVGQQDQQEAGQRLLRETVSQRRVLAEIEAALARLGAGTFGRCERCGGAVSAARLTRIPQTRYCGGCDH